MNPRKLKAGERPQIGHLNQYAKAIAELQKQVRQLSGQLRAPDSPAVAAWALNSTGATLRMGDAAAIQGGLTTDMDNVLADGAVIVLKAFETGSTAADDSGNWVIAENEIKNGQLGRVWVAGVCPARADGTGGYVDAPTDGSAVLLRGASGAKILQEIEDTDDGDKWVLIRIGTIAKDQPGGGGGAPGDQIPAIVDEIGYAGTGTLYRRNDNIGRLVLVGNPGTVTEPVAGGNFVPTIEAVKDDAAPAVDRGFRARLAVGDPGYADGTKFKAVLEALAAAGHVTKSGLAVPLDPDGFLVGSADGLQGSVGDGLEIVANVLKVLLAANPGLEFNTGGLRLKVGAAGDIMYCDGTKWVSLVKDAGKILESGAAAVSWVTKPTSMVLGAGTPTTVKNGVGAAGAAGTASDSAHDHPCTVTGKFGWDTVDGGDAGKIYAVYKPDPV